MTEAKKRDATKKYVQFSQAGGAKLMNGHLVEVATLAEAEASLRNSNEWKKWEASYNEYVTKMLTDMGAWHMEGDRLGLNRFSYFAWPKVQNF